MEDRLENVCKKISKKGQSYAEYQKERYKDLYRVEHHEFRVPRSVEENRFRKGE